MTTNPSKSIVVYDPALVDPEQVALAGLLGGYRGLTACYAWIFVSSWTSAASAT